MPIPIEVVAAQMALSHPDDYTAEQKEQAEQVMNEWHTVPCPHCVEGFDEFHVRICKFCLGDGKLWLRIVTSLMCLVRVLTELFEVLV